MEESDAVAVVVTLGYGTEGETPRELLMPELTPVERGLEAVELVVFSYRPEVGLTRMLMPELTPVERGFEAVELVVLRYKPEVGLTRMLTPELTPVEKEPVGTMKPDEVVLG